MLKLAAVKKSGKQLKSSMNSTILETILTITVSEKQQQGSSVPVIINFLKEQVQHIVLAIIYNHKQYKHIVFKGGSALRILYNLPRLSEDLDFDQKIEGFNIVDLEKAIAYELKNRYFPPLETKIQNNKRLYLKFPVLKNFGLAKSQESDKLYVKLEIDQGILPFAELDLTSISRFGVNFVARHYDLPTLMTGKIHAFLYRIWFKGKQQEVDIKGRDFYDLYWFLSNGIKPNWKALKAATGITNEAALKKEIYKRIKSSVTPTKLAYDLNNFLPDTHFVTDFANNYPQIIGKFLK